MKRSLFKVMRACARGRGLTQRKIAAEADLSLGAANKTIREAIDLGYLNSSYELTSEGEAALAPFGVSNAIILAAGMSTRFAPLSFEKPRAMFEVRGEILIERLIRQLKESGINDIVVVVGYMKEAFFYLEDEFGVKIIVNREYANRNNHSSLWCVRNRVGNSYVIPSDQYYSQTMFHRYNYQSYCTTVRNDGRLDGHPLALDQRGIVVGSPSREESSFIMQGPVYLDREFSDTYFGILEKQYDRFETEAKSWEQIFFDHVCDFRMEVEVFPPDAVCEFTYLTDLTAFDRDFFSNVDSQILDNICGVLGCSRDNISNVVPIKAGLTNLSTLFTANGVRYIYRHPGKGTDKIVNREAEAYAQQVAKDLGLDDTFVYENPKEGWKISLFVDGCSEFDYSDAEQVKQALRMARKLHTSGKVSPWSFDFYDEGMKLVEMLEDIDYPLPRDSYRLTERISKIAAKMRLESEGRALCHNDLYGPNFLVRGDEMRLIDWEYAAMGDPAYDFGNFIAQGSDFTVNESLEILPLYFDREPTEKEQRHYLAAVAVVGWYWYVWAMYKEAMGNPMGEWLYVWYSAAKRFAAAAEERYGIETL